MRAQKLDYEKVMKEVASQMLPVLPEKQQSERQRQKQNQMAMSQREPQKRGQIGKRN